MRLLDVCPNCAGKYHIVIHVIREIQKREPIPILELSSGKGKSLTVLLILIYKA